MTNILCTNFTEDTCHKSKCINRNIYDYPIFIPFSMIPFVINNLLISSIDIVICFIYSSVFHDVF